MTRLLFIALIVPVVFQSCQKADSTESEIRGQPLSYAQKFSLTSSEMIIHEPWPGAARPQLYSIKEVPKRVICTSTTHLPFLEMLEVETTLVGFPGTKYISSDKIRKGVENGKITDIGPDGGMNLELVLSLEPDLLIAFDMGRESGSLDKIEEAGIPIVYNADFLETSALGRAEWIKFFGAVFHKQQLADSLFHNIVTRYDSLCRLTKGILNRPTVLSGVLYGDHWFLPGGQNWSSQFIKDAGGQYIWESDTSSGWLELSFEAVFEKANGSDYWIGTSTFNQLEELSNQDSRYREFEAYDAGRVFNYSKRRNDFGGYDFFESGYARPDLVLADLIGILHPELLRGHEFYYFQRLP
ncbi:MAG: ABC transporter substrate-binding protein [Cyclobacteriaceae bacterium]|nr:ABC transporter substrate-binding protein [Cyclobacteriaceae bacterium HetDA_MAG_MS6]